MSVTLAQAKLNTQDALQQGVIDEFAKSSFLFNNLTFDDVVSPSGGGATMTYGYNRLITQPTADFRSVNSEYAASEVTKQRYTVDLKVFGGKFGVDRIIANMGGVADEVAVQMTQKIKAAKALFNDTVVNGDTAVDADAFDGLEKAITGTGTEYTPSAAIDLSTSAAVDSNWAAFLDVLDEFLMGLDGAPSFIGGNKKLIAKIRACARRAGLYNVTKDNFGQNVDSYNGYPLIDFGAKAGSNTDVVTTNATSGVTSLYAGRLALDGLHAVSMKGVAPVNSWLPDFKTSGAVKNGEVEMVAAIVLKATKAAGILRNLKVQPAA